MIVPPVIPLFVAMLVTVPALEVQPLSLLKKLNFISDAAFLDSVVPSCKINSVVPAMSVVLSVSSEKSRFKVRVPTVPPPLRPVPAVTPVVA